MRDLQTYIGVTASAIASEQSPIDVSGLDGLAAHDLSEPNTPKSFNIASLRRSIATVAEAQPLANDLEPILFDEGEGRYSIAHRNLAGKIEAKSFPYPLAFMAHAITDQPAGQLERYLANPRSLDLALGVLRPIKGFEENGPCDGRAIGNREFDILTAENRAHEVLTDIMQHGNILPSNAFTLALMLCERDEGLEGSHRNTIKQLANGVIDQGYLHFFFSEKSEKMMEALAQDRELITAVKRNPRSYLNAENRVGNMHGLQATIFEVQIQGKGINDATRAQLHGLAMDLLAIDCYAAIAVELLNDMQDNGNVCLTMLETLAASDQPTFGRALASEQKRQAARTTVQGFHSDEEIGEALDKLRAGLYHQLSPSQLEVMRENNNVGLMLLESQFIARGSSYALNYIRELFRQRLYDQAYILTKFIIPFDRKLHFRNALAELEDNANSEEIDRILEFGGIDRILHEMNQQSTLDDPLEEPVLKCICLILLRQYDSVPKEVLEKHKDFVVPFLEDMVQSPSYNDYATTTLISELRRQGRKQDANVIERRA